MEHVTDTTVSERYDEHQSSTLLGDTKSTQFGDEGEGRGDDDEGRRDDDEGEMTMREEAS
jgi:hypothetical protein